MNFVSGLFAALAAMFILSGAFAASNNPPPAKVLELDFAGTEYVHRWSKSGQNEFTPPNDGDLARWRDMITINVHQTVQNGDQLAGLANGVLSNYQSHGKILRTDSKPRTAQGTAEHLIVAILGNPDFLELAFARVLLVRDVGIVVVYSHRTYGSDSAKVAGAWLKTNGPMLEIALMTWDKAPSVAVLKQLPQSK